MLEAGHAGTCYIIRCSLGRLVAKVHVTMEVRQGSVEGPLCFTSSVRSQHHASPEKNPQQQRVTAEVPRGNTVSRLDLSDLCFVDDLESLLIFWRKSQLSRFAEMVSRVLESRRLRVNKSKLEVLSWTCRTGCAPHQMQKLPVEHYRFAFRGETFRATTVFWYIGCQVDPRKHAPRGTDAGYQSQQGPNSMFLWTGLLDPSD